MLYDFLQSDVNLLNIPLCLQFEMDLILLRNVFINYNWLSVIDYDRGSSPYSRFHSHPCLSPNSKISLFTSHSSWFSTSRIVSWGSTERLIEYPTFLEEKKIIQSRRIPIAWILHLFKISIIEKISAQALIK